MTLSIYIKGDYEEFCVLKAAKKQTQTKPKLNGISSILFINTEDCHSPSGFAMTQKGI